MGILDSLIASWSGGSADVVAGMTPQQQTPLADNAAGGLIEGFGNSLGAMSHIMYGLQARAASQFQAAQLRQNANTAQAVGERDAYEVGRNTDMVTSRALAVAAASGGGASDPTVVNLIARDAGEGAYQKALSLYRGADQARLMGMQADAKEFEGKAEEGNSFEVGAAQEGSSVASLLRSQARGASLYQRYAGGGPPSINDTGGWS